MGEALVSRATGGGVGTIYRWKRYNLNQKTAYTWDKYSTVSETLYKWNQYILTYEKTYLGESISFGNNQTYTGYPEYRIEGGSFPFRGYGVPVITSFNQIKTSYHYIFRNGPNTTYSTGNQLFTAAGGRDVGSITATVKGLWNGITTGKGALFTVVESTNSGAYPSNGGSGSFWYESAGSSTQTVKGSTSYGKVESESSSAYPNGGTQGGYWYENRSSKVNQSIGSYRDVVFSTSRNAYPDNGIQGDYWYVFEEM